MELLTCAKHQGKRPRLRAPLWPCVFSPCARSASTVQQGFGGSLPRARTRSHPCASSCAKLCGHAQRGRAAPHQTPRATTGLKRHRFAINPAARSAPTPSPKGRPRARCTGSAPPPPQPRGDSHHSSCLATYSHHLCSPAPPHPQARARRERRA